MGDERAVEIRTDEANFPKHHALTLGVDFVIATRQRFAQATRGHHEIRIRNSNGAPAAGHAEYRADR